MPTPTSLVIGIVYETFDTYPARAGEPSDAHAEYEPESTVETLEAALVLLGHRPLRIGSPHALLASLAAGRAPAIDAALSIAEGYGSRNREAWAPVLLEMAGVPALGSDALSLSLSLDKAWANARVAAEGIPTAAHCVLRSSAHAREAPLPADFPLFVKPRWEGTAKGIRPSSRVSSRSELACEVGRIAREYRQPALVEQFVPGAEYTVTIVGHAPPRALPVLQRALEASSGLAVHALESGAAPELAAALAHRLPGVLGAELEATLQDLGLRAFAALECRDYARADFRLDAEGRPVFLEINPLPSFAPDGTFGILAELEGRSVAELLSEVFEAGLERLGFGSGR